MTRNIVVTLECFVKKGNTYLLLHRSPQKNIMPDVWMAPGGHREFNEGLFECARREVFEETGLYIKKIRVKAIGNAYLKDLNKEFHFHMLVADYDKGKLKPNNDGEYMWLTEKEILSKKNLLAELTYVIPHICGVSSKIISYKAIYEEGNKMTFFELEKA